MSEITANLLSVTPSFWLFVVTNRTLFDVLSFAPSRTPLLSFFSSFSHTDVENFLHDTISSVRWINSLSVPTTNVTNQEENRREKWGKLMTFLWGPRRIFWARSRARRESGSLKFCHEAEFINQSLERTYILVTKERLVATKCSSHCLCYFSAFLPFKLYRQPSRKRMVFLSWTTPTLMRLWLNMTKSLWNSMLPGEPIPPSIH